MLSRGFLPENELTIDFIDALPERVGFEPTVRKAGFWALPVTICPEMTGFRP
jgi:hypothetical protein